MMEDRYQIKGTMAGVKITDTLQHVSFLIRGKEPTVLAMLSNELGSEEPDIVIPHIFPSGYQIDVVNRAVFYGHFGKITISDGIKIREGAFRASSVKEVVWPCDCPNIPKECFMHSTIKKVSNINNVRTISDAAFSFSSIDRLTWPTLCTHIPNRCFLGSTIKEIKGIENVETIGIDAFSHSELLSLDLANTNITFLEKFSLSNLPKRCKVYPPYYITQEDFEKSMMSKGV